MSEENKTISINNQSYNLSDLNDQAKQAIGDLQITDQEIKRLNIQINLTKTAYNAYTQALAANLPEKTASANKKKDVITIDDKKYNLADFEEQGQAQLQNLQVANQRLAQLQSELAIAQTARNAYATKLNDQLPDQAA